tara:strand:- start:49981 stop:50928 length:948 start_codon:yes stop_codon:yes gene_type:complete
MPKEQEKKPVICLMGPTASGKTDAAIALTQHLPCDLISVDSALIYRGMDIGTAKPDTETLKKFPHRLIDICDAADSYSAADFCRDVQREIDDIHAQGRLPLLVGGTMMYFNALQNGLAKMPEADVDVRATLQQQADKLGWVAMHERLQQIDPQAAAKIHPNDPQRLSRALEVYEITGQSLSQLQQETHKNDAYRFINTALVPDDRSLLHQRIKQRFDIMLEQGFENEVKGFYERDDLDLTKPAMRCVGYRQMWLYLSGKYQYEPMCERAIIATRQLAKRQLTWLRAWQDIACFDVIDEKSHTNILAYLQQKELGF